MMKITRLTTYWHGDQVVDLIDMIDELRDALINTYQQEINQYHQERRDEQQQQVLDRKNNLDLFDDDIDF
jgi:hypothetical protein